jgi:site-specific DNA recombinase
VTVRADANQLPLPPGTVPGIVSPKEHEAAVALLAHNRATSRRNNRSPEATLLRAGFVRCGYCGTAMSVNHSTPQRNRPSVYRCCGANRELHKCPAVTIVAAELDAAVWRRSVEVLTNPEVIWAEVQRRRAGSDTAHDLKLIDQRLAAVDRQRQNLVRAIGLLDEDQDSAALITKELSALSKERKELASERSAKASVVADETAANERMADLGSWCTRTAANLAVLTYDERRTVLEALGVRVRVWAASHEPRWEFEIAPLPVAPDAPVEFTTTSGSTSTR